MKKLVVWIGQEGYILSLGQLILMTTIRPLMQQHLLVIDFQKWAAEQLVESLLKRNTMQSKSEIAWEHCLAMMQIYHAWYKQSRQAQPGAAPRPGCRMLPPKAAAGEKARKEDQGGRKRRKQRALARNS
mmetsp:Transcript_38526/g.56632  ORF Transcript_38526/g.56632 Transcript_38526/m.56632 type:complete len:129 (-) Transcript_38526:299-685(-)